MVKPMGSQVVTSPVNGPDIGRMYTRFKLTFVKSKELYGILSRYNRQGIQAWQGFIRVDGKTYNWMGGAPGADNVDQQSLKYTSTRTTFTMNVGGQVQMIAEFFSPVYPDDLRRQSIPFSYLRISTASLDGRSHSVQIYADVSGGKSLRLETQGHN